MNAAIRLRVFGRTDVGQIREHNEDNFVIADLTAQKRGVEPANAELSVGPRGTLLAVCDGMGGAAAGEVASRLAVDIVYDSLSTPEPPEDHNELARRLVRAIEAAGLAIFNEARADRTRRGMGTTATVAALVDSRLFVAQVGDSRAYILRQGKLVQVSRDQSLANQLIEAGQLTEEEAETFEHNNIILQALGTAETVQVDLTYVDLCRGDILLLCSDGLSGMIRADEMREVLSHASDLELCCKELIDRANLAGGHDNVTVIVARFEGNQLPQAGPEHDLRYQKYALPGASAPEEANGITGIEPSELAQRAQAAGPAGGQRLRVAHTVMGMVSPFGSSSPPSMGNAPAMSLGTHPSGVPVLPAHDDPIEIPTTGLPPKIVGALMLGALVVVAVAGVFFFR